MALNKFGSPVPVPGHIGLIVQNVILVPLQKPPKTLKLAG